MYNFTENANTIIESIKSLALRKVLKDWIAPGDPDQTEDAEDDDCASLSVDDTYSL